MTFCLKNKLMILIFDEHNRDNEEDFYNFMLYEEGNEKGNVKEFDNSKMIHTLNKTINGHLPDEFERKIENKKYQILIGDLIEDIKMVDKTQLDTTLKIGILTKEMENEENLKLYRENFDIVLTEEENLEEIMQKVIH